MVQIQATWLSIVLLSSLPLVQSAITMGTVLGQCSSTSAKGWNWDQTGTHQISRTESGSKLCLEVSGHADSLQPTLQPCNSSADGQRWIIAHGTVALASAEQYGWVSDAGITKPDGAIVWIYDARSKQGYCTSHQSCSFTWADGSFKNPAGSCIVAASATPPPPPPSPKPPSPKPPPPAPKPKPSLAYTCAPGSAEASLPFCDTSLGFDKRSEDLVNRLNITEQIGFFFSYPGTPYIERYNLKTWSLDSTCIHGVASKRAGHVTVFPHAIAQGATWDPELIRRMSNITGAVRLPFVCDTVHSMRDPRLIICDQ
jgi:hypothetical protein